MTLELLKYLKGQQQIEILQGVSSLGVYFTRKVSKLGYVFCQER